jgi:uncharacterized RDD family membrane protein YckC
MAGPFLATWTDAAPDPLGFPALYDGLLWRRALAYLVDIVVIGMPLAMAWTGLVLLNDRRRALHDYLSGVVVVRRSQHHALVMPPLAAV